MAASSAMSPPALRRRLLMDIAEVQQDPYPNVHLIVDDKDITHSCLILTPPKENPLHLEIRFPNDYPLSAPNVTIQSHVDHPNVFESYICATILNTAEGWTPAYTLKGILIQLLSFFLSDTIEQNDGAGVMVDLASYRAQRRAARETYRRRHSDYQQGYESTWNYECYCCGFNEEWKPPASQESSPESRMIQAAKARIGSSKRSKLFELPDEVILTVLACMEVSDVISFSDAIPTIKRLLLSYDFVRVRELQCFCLKKSLMATKLGVGVSISNSKKPVLRSEFDLISNEAYNNFDVRKSVQGVAFEKWLPLPLSRRHWQLVRHNASHALEGLRVAANLQGTEDMVALYHMMNTIVVQFSSDASRSWHQPDKRSTLSHASEKAVESYFALFHLLLCSAIESPTALNNANRMVARFIAGPRTKSFFPDLGHLLVAALISTEGLTEELIFHVIKEAILRNVVWMLDRKGADMAELAYLEPSAVSDYRLQRTFEGSLTSYRLLMFLRLFSSAARVPGKTLVQLRDELFDTHSAPPPGVSASMASKIRTIRCIDSFPKFMTAMGITDMPKKSGFTAFLRRTINDSVDAGYSSMPMTQSQLFLIRRLREPTVERNKDVHLTRDVQRWFDRGAKWYENGWAMPSFFPNQTKRSGR